jgi:hypothetical protein
MEAKMKGAFLVEININPTPIGADLHLRDSADVVLVDIERLLGQPLNGI